MFFIRSASSLQIESADGKESSKDEAYCTPKPPMSSRNKGLLADSKKNQSARHIASLIKNPSIVKSKSQSQSSQVKGIKPASIKKLVGITVNLLFLKCTCMVPYYKEFLLFFLIDLMRKMLLELPI